MSTPTEDLVRLLDLEQLEWNLFRGFSPDTERVRTYGGEVLGQALIARALEIVGTELRNAGFELADLHQARHFAGVLDINLAPGANAVRIIEARSSKSGITG